MTYHNQYIDTTLLESTDFQLHAGVRITMEQWRVAGISGHFDKLGHTKYIVLANTDHVPLRIVAIDTLEITPKVMRSN